MLIRTSLLWVAFFLAGCGSTGDVAELPLPPPKPVQKEDTTRVVFQSRTDTVVVLNQPGTGRTRTEEEAPKIRFMVQIGAFKDPRLASDVQLLARQRYRMPVLNDYNIQVGLYQIRLGFFETRGDAMDFRRKMAREFPADYRDAWVVQLPR